MYDQEAKRAILGARSEALLGAHSGALLGAHSGALLGAHSGAHLGAQSGAHSGALLGAHSGAHLGAQSGAHSGALLGAHSGAHLGAHSGAHLGTQLPPPQKAQPTPLITGTLTLCEKDSIQDKTAFMLPFTMIISGPKASVGLRPVFKESYGFTRDGSRYTRSFRIKWCLTLNDLFSEAGKDKRITDLFTEGSHHRSLSVNFINQNLFGNKDPTQPRNCHYLVLFNNPVDKQTIMTLAR
ncbi:hypothetical protein MAR_018640 [Mya arenaria]|uniref:Glycine-zipper-containing OmpA-like membrane domain-containing protein n=1 Tax=Mya arenaria TaxID=6604 RepID=A0ABY7EIE9_MYAAR|nr:hypothetical protein MAR_018640 [Mya arenaria]